MIEISFNKHKLNKQLEKTPLISIITPVYNVEKYLPQCIESIIDQTFQEWELLLIDDGSTDSSGFICDKYATKDKRIRVLHKSNSGQADSRNIALQMARASRIGFVDSDDWIESSMFETLYNILEDNKSDIAVCGYFFDYKNDRTAFNNSGKTQILTSTDALNLIIEDKIIKSFLWDKLYRKSVIQELPPKSFYYEDYSTLFKWFMHAQKVAFCQKSLYHYRQRKSSTDNDGDPKKKYHFFLAELERYTYLHTNLPNIERDNTHTIKIVKVGIAQAKQIARNAKDSQEAISYIQLIIKGIKPFLPISYQELGFTKYRRLWEISHVLKWFVFYMRCTKKFSFKHKRKRHNYFD